MKTSIIKVLKKKTFWVSFVAVACSLGLAISPELRENIANLAVAVGEIIESLTSDG